MPFHVLRRGLAVATVLLTAGIAAPRAAAAETAAPYLPAPTGAHPVGTTSLYLKDVSRPDPWVPSANAREVMVSLWYPATSAGSQRARYLTPKESELLLTSSEITSVPPDILSRTRTNAYTDAEPAGGRRPLVVLSPGFPWPRSSLTALAEELASHGHLVAAIDHTYENHGMTFPDGRVVTCAACGRPDAGDFEKTVVQSRARDVPFVLDELTRKYPTRIDRSRIAMAGMSMGGASVGETMLADPRVRAGINLDGRMFKDLPGSGLSRPFLIFGAEGAEASWDRNWPHLTGWKRRLTVAGSIHPSFTDYDMLTRQIGVPFGGKLAGTRSVEITRRYVRAFLDLHLRGGPQPLLDRPSRRYPEVRFCAPETCR
ncbi:alpha/beta hydrolase family protein [Amycolatopsis suaedae]|uniref:Alpha/beta hydrolase n=1 Tax=Amycolatopsis suaedae TaxID=2510978 RepID=A0A4Q7J302_9PSEU|nr:alpha/beta hydrolase [Amycolatopsis suaedae]RZQ60992.1 alpha/beta hydrolase [Amycolatopsis suaedae]